METGNEPLSVLVELFRSGTKLTYNKGEFLIRPGGKPPGIFYIESGLVKAYDITKYGEENLLIIRKPGEILGLTWGLTGQERGIVYAAIAQTVVWQISRDEFVNLLHTRPEIALPLVHMLVEMYRLHSERILNLEYRTVRFCAAPPIAAGNHLNKMRMSCYSTCRSDTRILPVPSTPRVKQPAASWPHWSAKAGCAPTNRALPFST